MFVLALEMSIVRSIATLTSTVVCAACCQLTCSTYLHYFLALAERGHEDEPPRQRGVALGEQYEQPQYENLPTMTGVVSHIFGSVNRSIPRESSHPVAQESSYPVAEESSYPYA